MSYITQDLAELSLNKIGEFSTYIFMFHHDSDEVPYEFGEAIGANAISITGRGRSYGSDFLFGAPSWLNLHAFVNSTILVICPTKNHASSFKSRYKELDLWLSKQYTSRKQKAKRPELFDVKKIVIIAIPRSYGWDNPSAHQAHDRVLKISSELIKGGLASDAAMNNNLELLRSRLMTLTTIEAYRHKNTIISDTTGFVIREQNSAYESAVNHLLRELNFLKTELSFLKQTKETNIYIRQLNNLKTEINIEKEKTDPISLQASVGFEAFGNGIKLFFDSNGFKSKHLDKIKKLYQSIVSGKFVPKIRPPNKKNRNLPEDQK